jgi:polar amino acid transport system substrate-binding protein
MKINRRNLMSAAVAITASLLVALPTHAQQAPAPGESPTVDRIKAAGKIRAGVAIAWPWLGQDPATGKYIGAAADLGEKIAQTLGVEIEYVPSGWDVIVAGLQAQQFELALAPLFATPKRMAVIDFANYSEGGTCYIVPKDSTKVQKLEDLNSPDVVTGTFTGTGTEQEFVKKYPKAKINSVVQPPGGGTRVLEVINGRIDTAVFDSPIALALEAKYPQIKIVPDARECIAHPDIPIPIGVGFGKGDAAFGKFVTEVTAMMKPEMEETIAKYSTLEFLADQLGQ